jgi:hypothetical protein
MQELEEIKKDFDNISQSISQSKEQSKLSEEGQIVKKSSKKNSQKKIDVFILASQKSIQIS